MRRKKWMTWLPALFLVVSTLGGVALAVNNQQGSQANPLVTLDYLNEVVTPDILRQVDEKVAAKTGSGGQSGFVVVDVAAGQTLTLSEGAQVLLRSGSAVCVAGTAPGLTDATDGTELQNGGALTANHLYMSTTAGRGVKASATAKLMVQGGYTVA